MGQRFAMTLLPLILLVVGVVAAQSAAPGQPQSEPEIDLSAGLVPKAPLVQPALHRKDIPAIAKAANGVIVLIITSDKGGHPVAQGTGFLVSKNGHIVTNYHVIRGANSAIVKLPDGAYFDVDGVLAFDKARDLAVIKAHGQNFRVVTLGNSDRVQVGEEIVAIGSPFSLESTVSSGIVSGLRTIKEEGGKFLQVTAPISPGSSGGPLFNMAGEVVGITTLYLKDGENLNFAIPINDAKRLLSADSKVHDFPNETESVKSETHDGDAPSSSARPTAARAYYTQLYDAGGFFRSIPVTNSDGKSDALRALDKDYVCFSDDQQSGGFFAFDTMAYDEKYSKASAAEQEIMEQYGPRELNKNAEKYEEYLDASHTVETIQQRVPYVSFLDDHILGVFPSKMQTYLRQGGRLLAADFYRKGVKSGEAEYEWDGNSWVVQEAPDPSAYVKTRKIFRLSIEPTTLRYIERVTITSTAGSGETMVTETRTIDSALGSGMCEKIPDKRPN